MRHGSALWLRECLSKEEEVTIMFRKRSLSVVVAMGRELTGLEVASSAQAMR